METQVSNGRMTLSIFLPPPHPKTEHKHEMQWCVFERLEKRICNKKTFQLKANCLLANSYEQVWTGPWDGGSPCITGGSKCQCGWEGPHVTDQWHYGWTGWLTDTTENITFPQTTYPSCALLSLISRHTPLSPQINSSQYFTYLSYSSHDC